MKKHFFIFLFYVSLIISPVYAVKSILLYFDISPCQLKEITIDHQGWKTEQDLKDKSFSECLSLKVEGLKNISTINYYPIGNNETNLKEGMFEINNQHFIFYDTFFDFSSIELFLLEEQKMSYLLILGKMEKYGDKFCFIFDISNPDNIKFYPPEERFLEKEISDNFVGVFQNKLCFFFSSKRFDWNGQYQLTPYYIEDDFLKKLCDINGNPYFINYSYTTKYEQEYIIEDKNIPVVK